MHHLFPGICHTHYPAIAPIVMDTCKEFNVPYKVYPTVSSHLPFSCCCVMLEAQSAITRQRVDANLHRVHFS